ncbi:Hypothetical_protein [Hexamita inflata]|uniref:Hypothetical_protein n=1 Tax=Hexamita inflata TaxID=28002 RepID=A0AA86R245_9EUKA|nr:Hypothetical protein HINF_LOCUS57934 [Hexamita inflata]
MNETEFVHSNELVESIMQMYINVLQRCMFITSKENKDVVDVDLYKAAKDIIPLVIYKSLQILVNYEDSFQITSGLLFCFLVPICHVGDYKANPVIITQNYDDIHLTYGGCRNSIHQHTLRIAFADRIIHHINSNEFDNQLDNLISITVSKEELEYFKQNCDWISCYSPFVKHQQLHKMLNYEYSLQQPLMFENAIPLTEFDCTDSFYKRHIYNNIDNPEISLYEYENTGPSHTDFDLQDFIRYINKLFIR